MAPNRPSAITDPEGFASAAAGADPQEQAVIRIIKEIRYLVESSIDNNVTEIFLRSLPAEYRSLRNIRNFISVTSLRGDAFLLIHTGIIDLERLIQTLTSCFLPRAKELLGISPLRGGKVQLERDTHILRNLAVHALPVNLRKLQEHLNELKGMMALLSAA